MQPSVAKFNDHLRWKRYDAAARLISAEEQTAFYEMLSEVEETLDIQSIEVRHVAVLQTEPLRARVMVRSKATQLPSTIVKTVTQTQVWEHRPTGWVVVDIKPSWLPEPKSNKPKVANIDSTPFRD